MPQNPLLDLSSPVLPLDRIAAEHFIPAMEHAIAESRTAMAALEQLDETATIENLAAPIEVLTAGITQISNVYYVFANTKDSPEMSAVEAPLLKAAGAFEKDVYQNPALATRFAALYDQGLDHLSREDRRLMEVLHEKFMQDGAFLNAQGQAELRRIDDRLIESCSLFLKNLKDAARQQAVHVTDETELAGMGENDKNAHKRAAEAEGLDGYLILIDRLQVDNYLGTLHKRDLRRKLLEAVDAMGTQAPYDNEPVLADIQALRHQRAQLLGYENYAEFALKTTMAGSAPRVMDAIQTMAARAFTVFEQEIDAIGRFAAENGGPDTLEPWDSTYWAQRYMQAHFQYDQSQMAPYLVFDDAMAGFFRHAERLFDISFHANDQHPVYHEDVKAYDVLDNATGKVTGILYVDAYTRPEKRDGAWMEHIQMNMPGRTNSVIITMNYSKGEKVLMSPLDVMTLYHEGGHGLHGLLGSGSRYTVLQGTRNSPDYTEIPSMIQERWAMHPDVLADYARHYETGEAVPAELVAAMKRAETFFLSQDKLRLLQNSLNDIAFHTTAPQDYAGAAALEKSAAFVHKCQPHLRHYPLRRFMHPFLGATTKYAAGYYGYFWADLNSSHGFSLFNAAGVYDRDTGTRLKAMYATGARDNQNAMFEAFAGGPAKPDALLAEIGLRTNAAPAPAPKATHQ